MIRTVGGEYLTLEEAIRWFKVPPIVRRFGQWAVTEAGIDCLETSYQIDAEDLDKEDWVARMSAKTWVKPDDFKAAYEFAYEHHKVANRRKKRAPLPDVPLPTEFVAHDLDYRVAERLRTALCEMQVSYRLIESRFPDTPPPNERVSLAYWREIKDIGLLGSAYGGFANTLHALLVGIRQEQMIQGEQIFATLIDSEPKQLNRWLNALLDFAYPVDRPLIDVEEDGTTEDGPAL